MNETFLHYHIEVIIVLKEYSNDFFKDEAEDTTDFSLIKGDTMQQVEELEEELKRRG